MLFKKLFVILSKAKYLFNAVLRSFTSVQDDKFAKEKVNLDNCYIISILSISHCISMQYKLFSLTTRDLFFSSVSILYNIENINKLLDYERDLRTAVADRRA